MTDHSARVVDKTHRSTVVVHYPFHPLTGRTLEVVSGARHADGAVTVRGVDSHDLKIPLWMLGPEAATIGLAIVATLDAPALRVLVAFAHGHACRARVVDAQGGSVRPARERAKEGRHEADHTGNRDRSHERASDDAAPEQRRRLLELMAAAIVAVHRATEDASAEDVDDYACE